MLLLVPLWHRCAHCIPKEKVEGRSPRADLVHSYCPVHQGREMRCVVGMRGLLCSLLTAFAPSSPSSIKRGINSNDVFLEQLQALLRKANCKLTICSEVESRSDRWIQVIPRCL